MTVTVPTCTMYGNSIKFTQDNTYHDPPPALPLPRNNPQPTFKPSLPKKSESMEIGFHFHVLWSWFYMPRNTAITPEAAIKSVTTGILLPPRPLPPCLPEHWRANFKNSYPKPQAISMNRCRDRSTRRRFVKQPFKQH